MGGPTCTCTPINPSTGRFGTVVVDDDGHEPAVDDVRQDIAASDDVHRVPVVGNGLGELVGVADRRHQNRGTAANDARHLSAHAEEKPALLFVVVSRIALATVEIALVTTHRELVPWRHSVRNDHAAIVDAAVALGRDAVVELQLEVLRLAAVPDDEGIALDDRGRGDLSDQSPVLDAPVGRVPIPASERLAVEDRFETRLVASDGFGPIALFGHVRRCALLLEARGCNDRRQDNHAFHDGAM